MFGETRLLPRPPAHKHSLVPGCPVSADLPLGTEVAQGVQVRSAGAMAHSHLLGAWGACTPHPAMPITRFGKGNSGEQFL